MKRKETIDNQSVQLWGNLAQMNTENLKGIVYAGSQIFKTCETPDCASYICSLTTGMIQESYGFGNVLGFKTELHVVNDLHKLIHPLDRMKIHTIYEAICALAKEKPITSDDRLSCIYRIRLHQKYIQMSSKSGFAINELIGEVVRWTNLYAMPDLPPPKQITFKWNGQNFTHIELEEWLIKNGKSIFTRKELLILSLIRKGYTTCEIASSLYNSPGTIKKHVSNMFEKTGSRNRIQLLAYSDFD